MKLFTRRNEAVETELCQADMPIDHDHSKGAIPTDLLPDQPLKILITSRVFPEKTLTFTGGFGIWFISFT